MPSRESSERLIRLFEQELRAFEAHEEWPMEVRPTRRRVSRELDLHVMDFVQTERAEGRSPEQMLVELKGLLARAAPEVPGSRRSTLLASVTGRAISAFYETHRTRTPSD